MTTPTGSTYVNRLRAILATMDGIGTDVSDGTDLEHTPGYEVFLKGARHLHGQGSKQRDIERTLSLRVYHTQVADASKEEAIRAARSAVQDVIEEYVDTVFSHVNLSLDDAGIVVTGDAEDSIGLMPYGSHVYFGFDIDLTISYRRG